MPLKDYIIRLGHPLQHHVHVEVGILGRKLSHWFMALKGDFGTLVPSSLSLLPSATESAACSTMHSPPGCFG